MNYKTYIEAYEAAKTLREQYSSHGVMVKIEKSEYSGFILKLVPIDLMIDNLSREIPSAKSSRPTACC